MDSMDENGKMSESSEVSEGREGRKMNLEREQRVEFFQVRIPGFFVSMCVRVRGRLEFEFWVFVHRESMSVVMKRNGSSRIRFFVFVELCGLLIWEDKAQGIMSCPW
ncbi:hypothetical protein COLO4_38053 [Corchorus olitorius]|uniref:Uncharacterized protein n=1 Tax=Corchorus olitorius TaxID=93759 RepID=A0A1R3FX97_9ROSI|nr:hypothetical protein COLO4_38053 [Corchorus olitorius]